MKKIILVQTVLTLLFVMPAFSQRDTNSNPLDIVDTLNQDFGMFTKDEILNLSLRFDMTHYTRKKPKDEYLNAILTVYYLITNRH